MPAIHSIAELIAIDCQLAVFEDLQRVVGTLPLADQARVFFLGGVLARQRSTRERYLYCPAHLPI